MFQNISLATQEMRGLYDIAQTLGTRLSVEDTMAILTAKLNRLVPGHQLPQLSGAQQTVLVELRLDECERQARRQHERHPHLAHEIRQRADVIFVAVREHNGAHHLLPLP